MSKIAITFADELRARSDEDLAALFKFRPDLVTPVPNDFTSLAARATSTPSLVRALDSLNLWHYQIIEAACVLAEPFKKSEIVSITSQESNFALDYLWQMGLLYKEGNNFRTPLNLKLLIGEEPVGLGPELGSKVDFNKLKDIPKTSADVLSRLTWGPPRGQITNIKKPGAAIGWLLDNNILVAIYMYICIYYRYTRISCTMKNRKSIRRVSYYLDLYIEVNKWISDTLSEAK